MTRHPLQETCLGVVVGSPLLALIFVFLRVYSRQKFNVKFGWDDWCVVAATILSIALIPPSWKFVKMWHVGYHVWEIPPTELEPDYDEYYAVLLSFHLVNIPILPLVKVSMILLLLRIGSVISWLKKALYAILFFTVGSALIPWFMFIFICPPRTGNTWKPRTFGGLHCIGRYGMGEMLIWVTCANLLTDVLVLPIPFIIVKRWLSARWQSKLVVCAVFLCGLTVTGIGAAKIYLQYRDRLYAQVKIDWTYDINFCISHIENNVAIIMANIPILRGLLARWLARGNLGMSTPRTGHSLLEKEFRIHWPWRSQRTAGPGSYARTSSLHSQGIRLGSRNSSDDRKMLPCAQEDFHFEFSASECNAYPRCPSPVRISHAFAKTRSRTPPV